MFTECGGQCGCGFTGVIVKVNRCFVRLVACIGSTPSCALGNSCGKGFCSGFDRFDDFDDFGRFGGFGGVGGASFGCRNRRNKLGSVVDIPIDKICAVVRNSI
ncbi:MAG TPA: hypothetical protein DCP90_00720 [Clostridiales bacterium]|nr:MAG: hypothetical protein A2Y22_08020 [Clostridiales bacterium GWD2_32_59]HAN09120.1 hypothetical protein [Clostridiales bacterium]